MLLRQEIEESYLEILGRQPEGDHIYDLYRGIGDVGSFRSLLLSSDEFRQRLQSLRGAPPAPDRIDDGGSTTTSAVSALFAGMMGRHLDDPAYLTAHCDTLGALRRHLTLSPEFLRRHARRVLDTSRVAGDPPDESGATLRLIESFGAFEALTVRRGGMSGDAPWPRYFAALKPRLIVVVGLNDAVMGWLGAALGQAFPTEPVHILGCCPPGQRGRAAPARQTGQATGIVRGHTLVPECPLRLCRTMLAPVALLQALALSGLLPDLVVIGESAGLSPETCAQLFDYVAERGALIQFHPSTRAGAALRLDRIGAGMGRDVIHADEAAILQRQFWFFPRNAVGRATTPASKAAASALRSRLALAFIMRDEAHCVLTMLDAMLPIVGFVSCVDTGSQDGGADQVAAFLSERAVPHVIDRVTFTRFDEMRNRAAAAVPREFPWILMLDADEVIRPSAFPALCDLLDSDACDAWSIPRNNWFEPSMTTPSPIYPDRQTRLFRREGGARIHYVNAVHERLAGYRNLGLGPVAAPSGSRADPVHIEHLCFINEARRQQKEELYVRLGA